MKFRITYILLIFLFFVACNKKDSNENEYAKLLNEHSATDVLNYPPKVGDWTNRIYNIDETRISFIKKMNEIDGFDEIPTTTNSMNEMKKKLELISKTLHPEVKKLFDKYLYAVYFCEKLGGTGIAGFIYDNSKKKPVGGFIIIDSSIIQKKANDWITYKEKSAFEISDISLEIKIENETEDTIENALRYILLHEMGHVISNAMGITPDLRNPTKDTSGYPFFRNVWITTEESIYDKSIFSLRPSVKFYTSKKNLINLDKEWTRIYPVLQKTNFPTLYGAINALDHFAETFVSYVHCILDNRPWELTIFKNGKTIFKMKNRIYEMEVEQEFLRRVVFKN